MGKDSAIEWTDHTFNPWIGCQKVSEGCAHCYAERDANRWWADQELWGPGGPRRITTDEYWHQPMKWDAEAAAEGVTKRVFCASMSDLFEDRPDLIVPRQRLWGLQSLTPHLIWMILTKRIENAMRMGPPGGWQKPNLWLGTSAENQARLDERLPTLLAVPARVRFLSLEPLLGPITIPFDDEFPDADGCFEYARHNIHWVIVGGESGPGYRPMKAEWAEYIRWQCERAGVPFFMKQMGGWPDKRGRIDALPEALRMRAFPRATTGG